MTPRHTRLTAATTLAVLLLAACDGDGATIGIDSADAPTIITAPGEARTIQVLTHDSFALSEELVAAFTETTGITVEFLAGGDAGTVVNRAVLTKDNPEADVLFGVDNTLLARALEADLFLPSPVPNADRVDDDLLLELTDVTAGTVVPIDWGDVCINYDRAVISDDDAPESLRELTDPAFAGKLVVQDPATSSPGLAFLLATIEEFGEDGWEDFWRDLAANDVEVAAGWSDAYYGVFSGGSGEGTRPLVVSYASSPPVEVLFSDPQPDVAPTGVMDESCYRQIEYAGVLRGTDDRDAAATFVNWLLSREVQEDIPLNMFVWPADGEATLPDVFVAHADPVDDAHRMSPDRILANQADWIARWAEIMLG